MVKLLTTESNQTVTRAQDSRARCNTTMEGCGESEIASLNVENRKVAGLTPDLVLETESRGLQPMDHFTIDKRRRAFVPIVACSKACANASTLPSPKRGPAICKPIGSPAFVKPAGIEIVGSP